MILVTWQGTSSLEDKHMWIIIKRDDWWWKGKSSLLKSDICLVLFTAEDGRVPDGAYDAQSDAYHGKDHSPDSSWREEEHIVVKWEEES